MTEDEQRQAGVLQLIVGVVTALEAADGPGASLMLADVDPELVRDALCMLAGIYVAAEYDVAKSRGVDPDSWMRVRLQGLGQEAARMANQP